MEAYPDQELPPDDYKPFRIKFSQRKSLETRIAAAGSREAVLQTMLRLSQMPFAAGILGTAPAMKAVFRDMLRLADSDEPILILGETVPERNWLPGPFIKSENYRTNHFSRSIAAHC